MRFNRRLPMSMHSTCPPKRYVYVTCLTLDLSDGVEFLRYERVGDGHGIEVKFPLPDVFQCDACGHRKSGNLRV